MLQIKKFFYFKNPSPFSLHQALDLVLKRDRAVWKMLGGSGQYGKCQAFLFLQRGLPAGQIRKSNFIAVVICYPKLQRATQAGGI